MFLCRSALAVSALSLLVLLFATPVGASWTALAPGLDLGEFPLPRAAPGQPAVTITVLRIDPASWSLELHYKDRAEPPFLRTARQWCELRGLVAAINAFVTLVDFPVPYGFATAQGRVLIRSANHFQSVAAFDPVPGRDLAPFRIFDLDTPGVTLDAIRGDYGSVVQNLRLIKRPGDNRWQRQDKRWSKAALAEDARGRILFVFCRAPLTMRDFNEALLGLGIGVVAAQHLDGGPPAQLFVSAGGVERELVGSHETGARENEGNVTAWPIPIVLGVRRR